MAFMIAYHWIKKLKSRGIKEFEFGELPEDLKDIGAFQRAAKSELIEKIRSNKKGVATWRIKRFDKIV